MGSKRGRTTTIPLWKPTGLNVSNGSNYWANFATNGISANSASIPADMAYWVQIPVDAYRFATLTFYSRIATITSETGTDGHINTPVIKGMAHSPAASAYSGAAGSTCPAKPPEVGLSWAIADILHLKNSVAMIRPNPSNRATPSPPLGSSYMLAPAATVLDFMARPGVASAVGQEDMEQLYLVPIRLSEETNTTAIMFSGDSMDLTPLTQLWFAFRFNAGRTMNVTWHADTGIYVTLER